MKRLCSFSKEVSRGTEVGRENEINISSQGRQEERWCVVLGRIGKMWGADEIVIK